MLSGSPPGLALGEWCVIALQIFKTWHVQPMALQGTVLANCFKNADFPCIINVGYVYNFYGDLLGLASNTLLAEAGFQKSISKRW